MTSYAHTRRRSFVRAAVRAIGMLLVPMFVLLGLGRLMVALAPVPVEIVGDATSVRITIDGTSRRIDLNSPIVSVRPVAPIAFRREHQVDGSDSTNMLTFNPRYFAEFGTSPYYRFQATLREEWRYSIWTNVEVADRFEQVVLRQDRPVDDVDIGVPSPFRLRLDLERPEVPRSLDLVDADFRTLTVEIDRNDKYVRVGRTRTRDVADLAFWYFPRDWMPPAATLLDLLIRAVAVALGLVLVAGALALLLPARVTWQPGATALRRSIPLGLVMLLGASAYVAFALFDRAPHILDAIAYLFQAKTFASGALWVDPPFVEDAFPMPFSVLWQGRWFAQYPPGTALLLALGVLLHVPWLVQPLLAAGAVALIVAAACRQYGPGTALLVLLLLGTSPFLLLTAGAFLSHLPALFFGCIALYATTRYAERPSAGWSATIALGLGLALLTREIVAVLYGLVLVPTVVPRGALLRGWRVVLDGLAGGLVVLVAVGLYLGYNALLTGEPFLLPRMLFNSRDVLGFGPEIGFYGEHTVASGLVNAEQQLVSLGFYLAGWPYGFSLAVLLLPMLTRRLSGWDAVHLALALLFVLVYVAEFYHGIAFGPRYYFEALPSLAILTARGFAALTESVGGWVEGLGRRGGFWRARIATSVIAAALLGCNLVYFLPRQATLYEGFTGLPGGGPTLDRTIGRDLAGRTARLSGALVVTEEWWIYMMYFAALNCPRLDCPAIFAVAANAETRELLARMYPDRAWFNVVDRNGVLRIEPGAP